MISKINNIEYLVGSSDCDLKADVPFSNEICNFLGDLSASDLLDNFLATSRFFTYSDIKSNGISAFATLLNADISLLSAVLTRSFFISLTLTPFFCL